KLAADAFQREDEWPVARLPCLEAQLRFVHAQRQMPELPLVRVPAGEPEDDFAGSLAGGKDIVEEVSLLGGVVVRTVIEDDARIAGTVRGVMTVRLERDLRGAARVPWIGLRPDPGSDDAAAK